MSIVAVDCACQALLSSDFWVISKVFGFLINFMIMSYLDGYGFSDLECKIIMAQIERRAKYRKEFLRLRTDPCLNCKESGYVFDPAIQRFLSMKATQLEYFTVNPRTIRWGLFGLLLPMVLYGSVIWNQRQKFERDIRCGKLRPKDRLFKFA